MRFLGKKEEKDTKATNKSRSPPGMTKAKDKTKSSCNSKDEMRGSLRYAVHDTAVNGSGRDDATFKVARCESKDKSRSSACLPQ
jgi:hypothetical protein